LAARVQRADMHRHSKFRQNWSICCGDIALFWYLRWWPPPSWIFEIAKFYWKMGSSMPNIVKICQSVAKILRFFDFSRWQPPPSWIFKVVKFYWQTGSGGPRRIIVLNVIKIGLFIVEILQFFTELDAEYDYHWLSTALAMSAVAARCCKQQTDCSRCLYHTCWLESIWWPNFLNAEFWTQFNSEVPIFCEIPRFP